MAIRIGKLEMGEGRPRIAVPVDDTTAPDKVPAGEEFGVDIVELRIDQFSNRDPEPVLEVVRRFKDFPTIGTVRSEAEGGKAGLSEEERLALFEKILPEVGAVDIELSSEGIRDKVIQKAQSQNTTVIVSFHDFERTPPLAILNDFAEKAHDTGGDILKVAATCMTLEDVENLARFTLDHSHRDMIVVGMGFLSALTRIFFPALGSLLTFSFLEKSFAPGQMSLEETVGLMKQFYP